MKLVRDGFCAVDVILDEGAEDNPSARRCLSAAPSTLFLCWFGRSIVGEIWAALSACRLVDSRYTLQ